MFRRGGKLFRTKVGLLQSKRLNSLKIPTEVSLPASPAHDGSGGLEVGCRVLPPHEFRSVMAPKVDGQSPSYTDVCSFPNGELSLPEHRGAWKLEHLIVWLLGRKHPSFTLPHTNRIHRRTLIPSLDRLKGDIQRL
jgi:hypothetical protein